MIHNVSRSRALSLPATLQQSPRPSNGLSRANSMPTSNDNGKFELFDEASTIRRWASYRPQARPGLLARVFRNAGPSAGKFSREHAARVCYESIVHVLRCENESTISKMYEARTLQSFIQNLLDCVSAKASFVEDIVLYIYRYSFTVTDEMIREGQIAGHLIFLAAFLTALRGEWGEFQWALPKIQSCIQSMPFDHMQTVQENFSKKLSGLRPTRKEELKTLSLIFREIRNPCESKYTSSPSRARMRSRTDC